MPLKDIHECATFYSYIFYDCLLVYIYIYIYIYTIVLDVVLKPGDEYHLSIAV